MPLDKRSLAEAAEIIARRRRTVVLTGAGVSVESGIPDFRSVGGLWEKFDPMEYATIDAFLASPVKVWSMLRELDQTLAQAAPNPGHVALARLEEAQVVEAIITQNIDDLHQRAGSREVIEFHGNGRRLRCLSCGAVVTAAQGRATVDTQGIPHCPSCEDYLKPDVIFFGEAIPEQALHRSFELVSRCATMIIAGTSATVMPAGALPHLARQNGAILIEVNLERTELTASVDLALTGASGQVLPQLADEVLARLAS